MGVHLTRPRDRQIHTWFVPSYFLTLLVGEPLTDMISPPRSRPSSVMPLTASRLQMKSPKELLAAIRSEPLHFIQKLQFEISPSPNSLLVRPLRTTVETRERISDATSLRSRDLQREEESEGQGTEPLLQQAE